VQETAGIVEVEGAHLHYRMEGDGEPCLVVGSSVVYPRMFSPQLREHLQLVFFDLRQYAESDPSFAPDRITRCSSVSTASCSRPGTSLKSRVRSVRRC
jgi:hypothetical protein